ncbi:MAG: exo-alpha-sialidase [Ekhidna sp.]|uniref:exo-alpha-sialidase n=1 Tax=Ekhidna sp. TaxID=2608089 RepID=UPI0032ECBAC5
MKWLYLILLTLLTFCSQPQKEKPEETSTSPTFMVSPARGNASLPHLIKGNDNKLYISWVEQGDSNLTSFYYATLEGDEWTEPQLIASGNDWFVNWADYPMIAVDNMGNMSAHYLAKSSSGTYSYDVNVVLKSTGDSTWSDPIIPHTDGTPTEHGFVTMLPQNDGTFLLAWLDGRKTGAGDHGHTSGAMTLRSAVLDMEGNLSEEGELDEHVCDCCQTGGQIISDTPMIVYRDRSEDEIRDMAFVTKTEGTWSTPKVVAHDNWNIAGCPVNGPRIASYKKTAVVAWYTSALGRPTVKVAFLNPDNFLESTIIDDTNPMGRVDVVMINEDSAFVSWLDGGDKPAIKYRMVNRNGSMSSERAVSETSEARGSGFPQMELVNNTLYFAWTEVGEESTVRLAIQEIK